MSKFKAGDRVKQIKGKYPYQIGRIGTVVTFNKYHPDSVRIYWGSSNHSRMVDIENLEHYAPTDNETASREAAGATIPE